MEHASRPYLVLVGDPDYLTASHDCIQKAFPELTIIVAPNAVEAIRAMHDLDRPAVFIVNHDLPDVPVPFESEMNRPIAISGLSLITQNIRKTFRFDSSCMIVTDDAAIVERASKLKIRCLRKSLPTLEGSKKETQEEPKKILYELDTYFIGHITCAVEELKELRVDPMTKIYTLSGAMKRWERDFERARMTKSTTAFLLGDLNDLGFVNNKHGHLAADLVIYAVADVFRRNSRDPYDFPARLGIGDEFGLFMPETDLKGAEKVRRRIEEHLRDVSIEVSAGVFVSPVMSFGISVLTPEDLVENSREDPYRKGLFPPVKKPVYQTAEEAYKDGLFAPAEKQVYRSKLFKYKRLAESGNARGQEKYQQLKESRLKNTM